MGRRGVSAAQIWNWPQRVIKSIQYGTIALAAVTSNTATITSVNTAKSVLIHLGAQVDSTVANTMGVRLALTNATTITATRSNGTGDATVGFCVVEYY